MKKIIISILLIVSSIVLAQPLTFKIAKAKTNFVEATKTSLVNEPNCVFAMNGTKIGNTVVDISGNGNNGTVFGAMASGGIESGLQFDGVNDYVSIADANSLDFTGDFTIEINCKITAKSALQRIIGKRFETGTYRGYSLDLASDNKLVFGCVYDANTSDYATVTTTNALTNGIYNITVVKNTNNKNNWEIYLNGIEQVTIVSSQTLANGDLSNSVALNFGNTISSTQWFNGTIYSAKLYNVALTQAQVRDKWNKIANKPYILEDFSDGTVGKFPRDWTRISGTHTVQQLATAEGYLKAGTKFLRTDVAGKVAFKSDQSYGRWSFDVYKGADVNRFDVSFISSGTFGSGSNQDSYYFVLSNSETAFLAKVISGSATVLLASNTAYIANSTWYHIDIERTTAGVFSVWITGGAFTTKTLVSTVGGSGTNPITDNTYTSSKWFVLDLDALDRVTNIRMYKNLMVQ